ncbi:TPA: hypothetical protein HA246_02715 [Candidatus Woesearchaeota archaeon]|nr:hypothetical protein [Candidatus Woesearchaeota archaeon]
MTEIKILPGKHKCGKDFDMRIVDVKDDNKKIVAWIIHGFCKRCNVVIISNLHLKPEQPMLDRDFIVDYDMVSDEVEK